MTTTRHFSFYNMGAYHGESQRWVMCSFFSFRDGNYHVGQSQSVKEEEWPAYRALLERQGWTHGNAKLIDGKWRLA
jgi:hypothetical protein